MRKTILILTAAVAFCGSAIPATVALAQDAPRAAAFNELFAPLVPLVGRTWRGQATGDQPVVDYARWEWAVGGHAIHVTHALADGAYGGETLIFPDRDSGKLIFHYFSSGGFHTTGTITPQPDGRLLTEETVHGLDGMGRLLTTSWFDETGYHSRTLNESGAEFGGFHYTDVADHPVPALNP